MRKFNIKEIAMAISNAIRDFLPPELVEEIGDSDPLAFIINGLRETVVTVEQHERRLRAHDRSTDAIFERIEDLERAVRAYNDSPKVVLDTSFYAGKAFKSKTGGFAAVEYDRAKVKAIPMGEYEIYFKRKKED